MTEEKYKTPEGKGDIYNEIHRHPPKRQTSISTKIKEK